MIIGFTKMHGLGNDFIIIDNFNGRIKLSSEDIKAMCDRRKGIGADGVILMETKKGTDCFMNYYNADGSEAEMCGNGVRCAAKFLKDDYMKEKKSFKIATRAGIKEVEQKGENIFSVNMGKPVFSHPDFPQEGKEIEGLSFQFVSMGNPHAVALVSDLGKLDLLAIGPKVENDALFPNKINVELVEEKSKSEYDVKVWERACGATLACGTGACAVYSILRKGGNPESKITINLPGGKLFMSENKNGDILMEGPASSSFSGMVSL